MTAIHWDVIKKTRLARGISAEKMCEQLKAKGVSIETSDYLTQEAGEVEDLHLLLQTLNVLNVTIGQLLNGRGSSNILSLEEAQYRHDQGIGFVRSGAHTLFRGGYFSQGTFPSCVRSASKHCDLSHISLGPWRAITLKDIILERGFYPAPCAPIPFGILNAAGDHSVNLDDLTEFVVNSKYTSHDFKGTPGRVREIWEDYFNV